MEHVLSNWAAVTFVVLVIFGLMGLACCLIDYIECRLEVESKKSKNNKGRSSHEY